MKNALMKIIPKEQLEATSKQIDAVVKATDSNELHNVYSKINIFVGYFTAAVKSELINRIKKTAKKKGNKLETEIGTISLVERANFTYDEDKLLKFLKKKKVPVEKLFNTKWEVVTQNTRELESMEEKGLIKKTLSLNSGGAEELVNKYPELRDMIDNNPTYYLKGL